MAIGAILILGGVAYLLLQGGGTAPPKTAVASDYIGDADSAPIDSVVKSPIEVAGATSRPPCATCSESAQAGLSPDATEPISVYQPTTVKGDALQDAPALAPVASAPTTGTTSATVVSTERLYSYPTKATIAGTTTSIDPNQTRSTLEYAARSGAALYY